MTQRLTFTDWEHYTDEDGTAHSLDWTDDAAMVGQFAYPYLEALRQALNARIELDFVWIGSVQTVLDTRLWAKLILWNALAYPHSGRLLYTHRVPSTPEAEADVWWIWLTKVASGEIPASGLYGEEREAAFQKYSPTPYPGGSSRWWVDREMVPTLHDTYDGSWWTSGALYSAWRSPAAVPPGEDEEAFLALLREQTRTKLLDDAGIGDVSFRSWFLSEQFTTDLLAVGAFSRWSPVLKASLLRHAKALISKLTCCVDFSTLYFYPRPSCENRLSCGYVSDMLEKHRWSHKAYPKEDMVAKYQEQQAFFDGLPWSDLPYGTTGLPLGCQAIMTNEYEGWDDHHYSQFSFFKRTAKTNFWMPGECYREAECVALVRSPWISRDYSKGDPCHWPPFLDFNGLPFEMSIPMSVEYPEARLPRTPIELYRGASGETRKVFCMLCQKDFAGFGETVTYEYDPSPINLVAERAVPPKLWDQNGEYPENYNPDIRTLQQFYYAGRLVDALGYLWDFDVEGGFVLK